jgi:hypothetical protein
MRASARPPESRGKPPLLLTTRDSVLGQMRNDGRKRVQRKLDTKCHRIRASSSMGRKDLMRFNLPGRFQLVNVARKVPPKSLIVCVFGVSMGSCGYSDSVTERSILHAQGGEAC